MNHFLWCGEAVHPSSQHAVTDPCRAVLSDGFYTHVRTGKATESIVTERGIFYKHRATDLRLRPANLVVSLSSLCGRQIAPKG